MVEPRPRTDWKRTSNCPGGPGTAPKNKYNFTSYLRKVGDFVETHPMSREDVYKVFYAAHIWAWRHHCRIKTEMKYYPDGQAIHIEVTSNTRKERNVRNR